MEQTQHIRRYWIFQGMPDRYDLAEKLVPGETESWLLSHSHQDVNPGDVVYFWRGGRQSGLYGWGVVTDPAYQEDPSSGAKNPRWRATTRYDVRFESPILKQELSAGQLAGLVILRAPQGTNFKITTNEAIRLNQLINQRSETAPMDPVGTESASFPVKSIAPLNLGRSVTLIVGAGLRFTEKSGRSQFDGEILVSVLLAMAVSLKGRPRGTMPFLEKIFSGTPVDDGYIEVLEDPVVSPRDADGFYISDEVLDILESARLLAIYSTRKEEIGVRHLLAGLLLACRDQTLTRLEAFSDSAGIPLRELVQEFIDYTVAEFRQDDSSTWMSQFRSGVNARLEAFKSRRHKKAAETKSAVVESTAENLAQDVEADTLAADETTENDVEAVSSALEIAFSGRPVPDRPFGADLLRIESEVDALAHLFALQDEDSAETGESDRSTFALGLFGRWGSGKSFFIEKLKAKIGILSKRGNLGQANYCREIIQIDFNAWHYNEANIWASLVHHIFDKLQKHFQEPDQQIEFKNLIRELEISQERRHQLDKLIDDKQTQKKGIEENIGRQEKKIDSVIEQNLSSFSQLSGRMVANDAAREQLLNLLPRAAEILGLPEEKMRQQLSDGKKTASDIINVINEGGAALGQSQVIGRTIIRSGLTKVFIVCAGVVLLIYFALPAWLGDRNFWNELLPVPGQLIAMITPALVWLRGRLTTATTLFNEIGAIEVGLKADMRKQEEDKNLLLQSLREEQKRLAGEIARENESKELLDKEILDLQSKLDDLGSAESLVDYINDRAKSDDYRSQLGILALIRRDFEKLSALMTKSNRIIRGPGNSSQTEAKLPTIDRIILYIDDLDRVQDSKKVLQVLEAVHLLLAFPLFHVVVAVDERWAARSVLSHHGDFFGIKKVAENSNDNELAQDKAFLLELIGVQPATPREFLEKIFQISFWVRPLTEQLTEGLIDGVVKKSFQTPLQAVDESDDSIQLDGEKQTATAKTGIEVSARETTAEQEAGDENIPPGKPDPQAEPVLENNSPDSDDTTGGGVAGEISGPPLQVDFDITNEELISMRALGLVVNRSPRTVKRFINTYRLFKAMKIPPGEGGWTEQEPEAYDILEYHVPIMTLLSVQVGYPDIAVRLFEHIDQALNQDDSQELGPLLDQWRANPPEKEAERKKWLSAIEALSSVHDLYGEKSRLGDLTIDAFNPWLLATSRFGFQEWVPGTEHLQDVIAGNEIVD